MVEERVNGKLVLNQPAGHLEPDESLIEAALRETLRGNRLGRAPDRLHRRLPVEGAANADGSGGRHYLRFAFAAEPVAHDPARTLDEGIVRALWMTPGELQAAQARHRSPLVWRVVGRLPGRPPASAGADRSTCA